VKLKAIIGDTEEEVGLELDGGRVKANIGARSYEFEAREIEPGTYHARSNPAPTFSS
jgi:hypothetical protein